MGTEFVDGFGHFSRHLRGKIHDHRPDVEIATRVWAERAGVRRGVRPDYLVIGAMKAGSTTFYDWLVTHPLAPAAAAKEVHFFDSHFRRGMDWYTGQLPTKRRLAALASRHGSRAVAGEATPNYLFHPLAARRAASIVPDAKLIVLLRNPVDRAFSHYQTNLRHDWEALSFEEALDREDVRLEGQIDALLMDEAHHRSYPRYRWSYAAMGRYAELLERWFERFPRTQFHFVLTEDLDRDRELVFARVWEFLGLPAHTLPDRPRRTVGRYQPLAPATRTRLEDYFRPHNARLAELIGIEHGWDA